MAEAEKTDAQVHVPYEETQIYRIRHSAAHVMAEAVREMYPDIQFAIGPPVENGFYYDFDLGEDENGNRRHITEDDFKEIEKRMRKIINKDFPFEYKEVTADEARGIFKDQPYKLELIDGLAKGEVDEYGNEVSEAPTISTYTQNTFEDLCRGPHVESTKQIPADGFKLMNIAGAYWRGDENNPMLDRIYATAWNSKTELKEYLQMLEEAKKRDHRKLGKALDIFTFDEEVGQGLPLWLPNGGILIEELENFAKEMEFKAGYDRVKTPHVTKEDLFVRSGHLPYYAESMFPPMELENVKYYLKPMNCPMHHKLFDSRPRSYRDLPMRLAEYGTVYRYEQSGELFGLMRVRSMQMNDAHIYCSVDQFEEEFLAVIDMYLRYFEVFDIERYVMRFSTHSAKRMGKKYVDKPELWQRTEDMVRTVMTNAGIPFVEVPDEAAFYGPKIDVQIFSAIGREFTLATNQVDFAQPANFDLKFINAQGEEEQPLCIHRAPLSTHERLIGFLIEHYAGAFPVWLAPQQAVIIPITDAHLDYCYKAAAEMRAAGIRAKVDDGGDRMNKKIRTAQKAKIPYMLIVGDQEVADSSVALRARTDGDKGAMPITEFIAYATDVIKQKKYE